MSDLQHYQFTVFFNVAFSICKSSCGDLHCKILNLILNSEKRLHKLLKMSKFRKGGISLKVYIIKWFLSSCYFQSTSRYAFYQFSLFAGGLYPLMPWGSMTKMAAKNGTFNSITFQQQRLMESFFNTLGSLIHDKKRVCKFLSRDSFGMDHL